MTDGTNDAQSERSCSPTQAWTMLSTNGQSEFDFDDAAYCATHGGWSYPAWAFVPS